MELTIPGMEAEVKQIADREYAADTKADESFFGQNLNIPEISGPIITPHTSSMQGVEAIPVEKLPFGANISIVQPEDSTTTRAVLDKTPEEKKAKLDSYTAAYIKRYESRMKKSDGSYDYTGRDFDREKLIQAGVDTETIDSIELNLRKSLLIPEEGLESDFVLPITPEFALVNKLAEPLMKPLGQLGAYALRSWQTRGIPRSMVKAIESGDKAAIAQYLKEVEDLKGLGFGDEMLSGGKISSNVFEQQKYADDVLSSSIANFRKQIDKELPFREDMPKQFSDVVTAYKDKLNLERNAAYTDMKGSASSYTYNIKALKEDIHKKLTSSEIGIPEEAYNKVMNIINYQQRTLSPAQKGAKSNIKELTSTLENVSNKLELAKTGKGKGNIGSLSNQVKSLKNKIKSNKDLLPDEDYVNELDFVNMIQRINANSRGSHFGLSTSDAKVLQGLKASKRLVDDFFEQSTKQHNPDLYNKFKVAQDKASSMVRELGVEGKRTPLGEILDTEDVAGGMKSIMENPYKVGEVGSKLEELAPGMGKDFAETWLQTKLSTVKEGSREVLGKKGLDFSSLSGKLDSIVSNPETVATIEKLLGPEKVTQLRSLKAINDSLQTTVKSLGIDGPLEGGLREYVKEGGLTKGLARSLELVIDKTRQLAGGAYDKLPGLAKVPGLSKLISGRFEQSTDAMKRLSMYAKEYSASKDKPMREFFEKRMGAISAEMANEEGLLTEETIPILEQAIEVGIAPAALYKVLGLTAGTAAYDVVSRAVEGKTRKVSPKEEDRTNVMSKLKDWWNK